MKEYEITLIATQTLYVEAENEQEALDKIETIIDMKEFEIIDRAATEL